MARPKDEWMPIGSLDEDPSLSPGVLKVNRASLGRFTRHSDLAIRCQGQEEPVRLLSVVHDGVLAALVSSADYTSLRPASPKPLLEARPLTGGERVKRFAGRATLPALGAVGVGAVAAGALGLVSAPVTAPIAALTLIPAAGIKLVKAVRRH